MEVIIKHRILGKKIIFKNVVSIINKYGLFICLCLNTNKNKQGKYIEQYWNIENNIILIEGATKCKITKN